MIVFGAPTQIIKALHPIFDLIVLWWSLYLARAKKNM
jgi:hypothetical protein